MASEGNSEASSDSSTNFWDWFTCAAAYGAYVAGVARGNWPSNGCKRGRAVRPASQVLISLIVRVCVLAKKVHAGSITLNFRTRMKH